jgi:hypothetical protein
MCIWFDLELRFIVSGTIVKKNTTGGRVVIIHLPVFYTPDKGRQKQSSNTYAGNEEDNDDAHVVVV